MGPMGGLESLARWALGLEQVEAIGCRVHFLELEIGIKEACNPRRVIFRGLGFRG